jgi:hypothetical protein
MKATDFEYRHQTLLHQFIVAAAFLAYLIQRDDIVWQIVRNSAAPRELERSLFVFATFLIFVGAGICIWARAYRSPQSAVGAGSYRYRSQPRYLGDLLYAVGLGSLAPPSGFVILVAGEGLRLYRLTRHEDGGAQNFQQNPSSISPPLARSLINDPALRWRMAFRQEAAKWGLVFTMIVFAITLKDRLAEMLAAASFLVGLLFQAPFFTDPIKPR